MPMKIDQVQNVLQRVIKEEKAADALRREVSRVLGQRIVTEACIAEVARETNDYLDVVERSGTGPNIDFRPSVMLRFAEHASSEVRRLVARTVPQKFLARFKDDKDEGVRVVAGRRMPRGALLEMIRRHPHDEELRHVYAGRLHEAHEAENIVHTRDPAKLSAASKQQSGPELSSTFYEALAFRFMQDYGKQIEFAFEESLAHRYAESVRQTVGMSEFDDKKFLKAIYKQIEEREERALDRNALKETVDHLRSREPLDEAFMPIVEVVDDPVHELLESNVSNVDYVSHVEKTFRVKYAPMPSALRKYRIGEGRQGQVNVPVSAFVPGRRFRAIDEQALDRYVKCWNEVQIMAGEPIRLGWSPSPTAEGAVSFDAVLR